MLFDVLIPNIMLFYGLSTYKPKSPTPFFSFPPLKTPVPKYVPLVSWGRCYWFYSYLSHKRTSYLKSAHQVTWESATFMQNMAGNRRRTSGKYLPI